MEVPSPDKGERLGVGLTIPPSRKCP